MPSEDRRISFDNEEVYKAVFALCTQKQLKKPIPGHITAITQSPDATTIFLDIENPHAAVEKTKREEYTADFMAAALMLFCRGCGIPLPKSARKSVIVAEGQLVLRVQI